MDSDSIDTIRLYVVDGTDQRVRLTSISGTPDRGSTFQVDVSIDIYFKRW